MSVDAPESSLIDVGRPTMPRYHWLDVAKGLGILLVVYGHAIGGTRDAGLVAADGLIATSFYFLYTFHMPMFMFLSGTLVKSRLARGRVRFLNSFVSSLIVPYFIWSVIAVVVFFLAAGLTNGGWTGNLGVSLASILWNPPGWLWFFYSLLIFHLIAIAVPWGGYGLLLIGLALLPLNTMLNLSPILSIASHMFVFYALGVLIGPTLVARPFRVPPGLIPALAVAFAASSWLVWKSGEYYWSLQALPAAITGAALVIALSASTKISRSRVLNYLGRRSLAIYALHVFFVAGIRIVFDRIFGVRDVGVVLPVVLFGGLVGPLIIYEVAARMRISEWIGLGKPSTLRQPEAAP